MRVSDPQTEPKPQEIYLPVEGVNLQQPLPKIVSEVERLKQDGRNVIASIRETDETEIERRNELTAQLISIQNNLTRWGVALFAHMPYKFPPDTFALSD